MAQENERTHASSFPLLLLLLVSLIPSSSKSAASERHHLWHTQIQVSVHKIVQQSLLVVTNTITVLQTGYQNLNKNLLCFQFGGDEMECW